MDFDFETEPLGQDSDGNDVSGARVLALLGDSVTGCRFVWT
jgi:hypothetical protein